MLQACIFKKLGRLWPFGFVRGERFNLVVDKLHGMVIYAKIQLLTESVLTDSFLRQTRCWVVNIHKVTYDRQGDVRVNWVIRKTGEPASEDSLRFCFALSSVAVDDIAGPGKSFFVLGKAMGHGVCSHNHSMYLDKDAKKHFCAPVRRRVKFWKFSQANSNLARIKSPTLRYSAGLIQFSANLQIHFISSSSTHCKVINAMHASKFMAHLGVATIATALQRIRPPSFPQSFPPFADSTIP
jgi:hypothetical protein